MDNSRIARQTQSMVPTRDERLRGTRLVQACRCGEALVSTRFAFGEHATQHFKVCKALKTVSAGGPVVRAQWHGWEPVDEKWAEPTDPFRVFMATYAFDAPLFVYANGGVVQGRMIESAIADVRHYLAEGGSIPDHAVPAIHGALLRMIEHPRSQSSVRGLLALRDEESPMGRRDAVIEILHRVALGLYG